MTFSVPFPPANRLLAELPPDEFARLAGHLTSVTFAHRQPAYRTGGPLDFVYFPVSGMMSSVAVMRNGDTAEVAAVGREGMLGVTAYLGAARSAEDVFCQVAPCECLRLPAAEFAAKAARGGPLQAAVHAYLRGVMAVSAQLTACNCLHPVEARGARWLLMCRDRAGSDEFRLTQELLATMLGVRRATVSTTAKGLMDAGLLTYRHGRVRITDGPGLERAACECYPVIRAALPAPSRPKRS